MTPPIDGVVIDGGWHLTYAIYLDYAAFDRLVEAVHEQRAKESL